MGLDITYYRNAKPVSPPDDDDESIEAWRDEHGYDRYHTVTGFEDRLEGFKTEWIGGEYVGDFRAGSYGGYNHWRALLCRVMLGVEPKEVWDDPGKWRSQPFYGLINFADNEGCIGPVWSARLAKEFAEGRERFAAHPDVEPWALEKYDTWAEAFKTAADNGFVAFH